MTEPTSTMEQAIHAFFQGGRAEDTTDGFFCDVGEYGRLPTKGHADDAGWDLYVSETAVIEPHAFKDIRAGIRICVPTGYFTRITGRSSTIRNRGLLVAEGIIDSGYRGELFAGVWNLTGEPVTIEAGERVAQLLIHRVIRAEFQTLSNLPDSARGTGGFGSTGV